MSTSKDLIMMSRSPRQPLVYASMAILFQALPLFAEVTTTSTGEVGGNTTLYPPPLPPVESYLREPTAKSLLYGHISLMLLGWVAALPISMSPDSPLLYVMSDDS